MLPARLQRAYGVIYTFEPMGKPIGYNPARLQRAYLPMPGIELLQKMQKNEKKFDFLQKRACNFRKMD